MSTVPWLERTMLVGPPGTGGSESVEAGPGESRAHARPGPLRVYLPYEGESNRSWIRAVVGKGVPFRLVADGSGVRVWELSAVHLLAMAAAMADRYGEIEMRIQVSPATECSYSCQDAEKHTVWKCVCICAGQHHGGKGTHDDWFAIGRFRIRRLTEEIHVKHIMIGRGQIPLPETISRAALAAAVPTPPPQPPAVQREEPAVRPVSPAPPPRPAPPPAPPPPAPPPVLPPRTTIPREPAPPPDRAAAPPAPAPRTDPPRPGTTSPPRPSAWIGPLVAAAAVLIAVIGVGAWLLRPSGDGDPASPPPATGTAQTVSRNDPLPPPPVSEEPEPLPPPPAAPPPAPRGCYPFQQHC